MSKWTSNPPPREAGYGMRLIRTPANGKLNGLITCDDLIGTPTHYFGGRTVPCDDQECKACEAAIGWRWHAYVPIVLARTHEHCILELTAQAAQSLKDYRKENLTLRGTWLSAQRAGNRRNGRVIITLAPHDLTQITLPPEPDVQQIMLHIWGIQASATARETYAEDRGRGFKIQTNERSDNGSKHLTHSSTRP